MYKTGAGNRVRTGDLYLGKVPLYQLSYSRSFKQNSYNFTTGYTLPYDGKADILITSIKQSRTVYPLISGFHALLK